VIWGNARESGWNAGWANARLLTIYDLELELKWKGMEGEEAVEGTLKVPEVSHEAIDGLADYVVSPYCGKRSRPV
jgi:hypothetical protein